MLRPLELRVWAVQIFYYSIEYTEPIISDMIEAKANVTNIVQPDVMDSAASRRDVRAKFASWRTVRTASDWLQASPTLIGSEVKLSIAKAASERGLLIALAYDLEPDGERGIILAFLKAVEEYG